MSSFAKQRFDSTAEPVAKMALMRLPIAVLLAYIGSDVRHPKDKRDRAVALLEKFTTKFCLALGLSADWGVVTRPDFAYPIRVIMTLQSRRHMLKL